MASGLMGLAYLGEMGIVFNLAYIELKKTRYLDSIKDHISATKNVLNPIRFPGDSESFQVMTKLRAQLDELLDSSRLKRKEAWVRYKGLDDIEHFDFFSGTVIDFFNKETDKLWSQIMVVIASLSVLAMTIFSGIYALHELAESWKTWAILFSILVITNLTPLFFVIVGRMLKKRAQLCTDSIQSKFTSISQKSMESVLDI